MVGFQQSAQTLDADALALVPFMLTLDDLVDALVNPLMTIVLEILRNDISQLVFREEDEMVESFFSDGPHESLSVGIQIRTARGVVSRIPLPPF